jgi:hypothetical protein
LRFASSFLAKGKVIELEGEKVHNLGNFSNINVRAYPLKHKDVACFGFFFKEEDKPGWRIESSIYKS